MIRQLLSGVVLALCAASLHAAEQASAKTHFYWQSPESNDREQFVAEPMPPGVTVIPSELFGPVFATTEGKALYVWPLRSLRNGDAGDRRNSGKSTCDGTIYKETAGYMSPYPAGFLLPELDKRQSCEALWPALMAGDDAKPVGKWTLATRTNGQKQWAYDGYPVYLSSLDKAPGDVLGGSRKYVASGAGGGEVGAVRLPIGPEPDVPPELDVLATSTGRMLVDTKGFVVFASDADPAGKSTCVDSCLKTWKPILAPQMAKDRGEWSIVERSPGIKQWAFRGKPLYIYIPDASADARGGKVTGADVPGWHIVFTQRALPPPSPFTVADVEIGQVLADGHGKTVYLYNCNDDAIDQQSCNHPDATQAYRMAVCGAGDAKRCLETFPYVLASPGATSASRLWSVMAIDPNTGHRATAEASDTLHVWAYLGRPVYTFGPDQPGEIGADAWGEFNGYRNGYKAFWLRDDFRNNAF